MISARRLPISDGVADRLGAKSPAAARAPLEGDEFERREWIAGISRH